MDSKISIKNPFKIEDILFIVLVIGFILFLPFLFTKGADLACILSSGEYVYNKLSLITPSLFIYTEPNQFYYQSTWLSDILFFFLYKNFGLWILILLCSVIVSSMLISIYRQCSKVNPYLLINLTLLIFGIIAISDFLEINSRIFSYLLFTILYYKLKNFNINDLNKFNYILFILIFALWSNINTDFIFGLIVISIFVLISFLQSLFFNNESYSVAVKNYFKLLIICIFASLLNLNLFYPHLMLLNFLLEGYSEHYEYLASPNFHIQLPYFFMEAIILLLVFLAGLASHRPKPEEIALVIIFMGLSLFSAMNVAFFIIISLPIIAEMIINSNYKLIDFLNKKIFSIFSSGQYTYKPIIPVLFTIILVILSGFTILPGSTQLVINNYPSSGIDYIKQNNLKGRILSPLGWGCYVNQNLKCKVFSTENIFMQNKKTLKNLESINDLKDNYNKILKKYNIDLVLFRLGSPLDVALSDNTKWQLLYKDSISVIYKRK